MEQSLSIIYSQRPYEYIQIDNKNRLNEIFQSIDKSQKNSLFLFEDEKIYKYIFFYHAINNLFRNSENTRETIPVETPVSYNNIEYIYKGIDEDNLINLEEVPAKRVGQNSPVTLKILNTPLNFKKIILLGNSKRGRSQEIDSSLLSDFLDLSIPNIQITESILVVCNHKVIEDITSGEFTINNEEYYHSEVFPTVKLARDSMNYTYFKNKRSKNNIERLPTIIFSSSLSQATMAISEDFSLSEFNTKITDVIVIGDNFLTELNLPELFDLEDITHDLDINYSVYGSSKTTYSYQFEKLFKNLPIYSWTPPYVNNSDVFKLDPVKSNLKFDKAIENIDNYINELRHDHNISLVFRFLKIKSLMLKQFSVDPLNDDLLAKEISEVKNYDIIDDSILSPLQDQKRHFHNYSSHLLKVLKEDNDYTLLVCNEMYNQAISFLNYHQLNNECITEEEYSSRNDDLSLRIVSPYISKKFLIHIITSFKGKECRLIYPKTIKNYIEKNISYINYSTHKNEVNNLVDKNQLLDNDWYFNIPKDSPYSNLPEQSILIDKENDIFNDIEDFITSKSSELNLTDKEFKNEELFTLYTMESEKIFFANRNSYFYYLDSENKILRKNCSDFLEGDDLLFLSIPYTNDLLYDKKESLINIKSQTSKGIEVITEEDIILNDYWKNTFRSYSDRFKLTIGQLSDRFSRIGFIKSNAFYQAWLNSENNTIVPQDAQFIFYIGKLTDNDELVKNYKTYFEASSKIRRVLRSKRSDLSDSLLGKNYEELLKENHTFSVTHERIKHIKSSVLNSDSSTINTLI